MKKQKITKDDNQKITYASSGVNIEKANDLIEEIKPIIKNTQRLGADGTIGGFGGIFDIGLLNYNDPLLVSSTDGVGTKLLVAIENDFYDHIGIDLVAMCVNDLIVQGAEPLYFLDYFATGQLSNSIAKKIFKSISYGCIESNCALIGFSVGVVERNKLLPKQNIEKGDLLIGLPSNGLHSNGYSLVRNIINQKNINISLPISDKDGETIVENLLRPTKIYVRLILELLKNSDGIKAISNITGGGITENLPRIFPNSNIGARINLSSWKRPSIFNWLQEQGNIDDQEILKTLNCGIGMILIANRNSGEEIFEILEKKNEAFYIIGEIIESNSDNSKIIFHRD